MGYAIGLLVAEKQVSLAVEIMSLIVRHPVSSSRALAQVAKYEDTLKTSLPSDVFHTAWERGQTTPLGDYINRLIES
jgi:hypothetical protein